MDAQRKNKDFNPYNCPVTHCLNLIGGKWKILIIYAISKGCNRFGKLQKTLSLISKQMLVNQLRELEDDQIIERKIFAEMPPRVEYSISLYGQSLMPVIAVIQQWGLEDMATKSKE
ncbi:winged helix-turn-helix transcriptional regulator [Mucilaginibacter sp. X4EP1]|uniref:winged helix-turn-helix transcriptional regulator n=1 Tax=Mucilaginibacter sp. X4EP1 TaxID=2723092 RepID=UPI002168F987|nr:helix-turn-helix domain-containing protein [Mucilaginibacter sp. X4EP1]MCS3813335.1 DNA-binding HxlR family transcriptional regulator [Mucilaginibacter sp. X4EP1]